MSVADIVYDLLARGKNVVLHGPGGTGKSYTIRSICSRAKLMREVESNLKSRPDVGVLRLIATVTPTGISAVNLTQSGTPSRTIHSWSGIKSGAESAAKLAERVMANKFARNAWMGTTHLIIDEISMLGRELWEKLNYIGQYVRRSPLPFGGITIMACGDFFQLPPVKDEFVFESEVWRDMPWTWIELTVPKRYENVEWFESQLRLRQGEPTDRDWQLLEDRIRAYDELLEYAEAHTNEFIVKPTILHCTNVSTDAENVSELRKLKTPSHTYRAQINHVPFPKKKIAEEYVKALFLERIPEVVSLKVGAQVMLKANIDVENSLANGSRGVITEITEAGIHVLWATGSDTWVINYVWSHEDENGISTCSQIPLVLAWSITIHKSQSLTLDSVAVDLQGVFDGESGSGQGYVGISRCRTYEGLYVLGLKPNSFRANPKVKAYVSAVLEGAKSICSFEVDTEPISRQIFAGVSGMEVVYYPRLYHRDELDELDLYRCQKLGGAAVQVLAESEEVAASAKFSIFLEAGTLTLTRRVEVPSSRNQYEMAVVAGSGCRWLVDTLSYFRVTSSARRTDLTFVR